MASLNRIYYAWIAEFKTDWQTAPVGFAPPDELLRAWAEDGIRPLSLLITPGQSKIVLEATGDRPPSWICQRMKGRLQHHLAKHAHPFPGFTRDLFCRSLGQNDKSTVQTYIREQVNHSDLVDPLYRASLNKLRFMGEDSLKEKTTHRSVYDLFLHVIFIVAGRYRMNTTEAQTVAEAILESANDLNCTPVELSVMPDHVHFMCSFPYDLPPVRVLESLKEQSANRMRRLAFWNDGGYTGTVGPYRLAVALKRNAKAGAWIPGGE